MKYFMNSSAKLIIRKRKLSRNDNYIIILQYYYASANRVLISKRFAIPHEHWEEKVALYFQHFF